MKSTLILCCVASCLCVNVVAKHSHCSHCSHYDHTTTHSGAHHTHTHTQNQQKEEASHSDGEVAKMAVSALASMATNMLSIGADPSNPQNIGTNVISMISSFVNLITFAMKNPHFAELMEDELFRQELCEDITKSLVAMQAELAEEGNAQE